MAEYKEIPLSRIITGKNPVRTSPLDVQDLKESISFDGILQPILVQPKGNKYEIICGYRRYEAAKSVFSPNDAIPCMVLETPLSADEVSFLGAIENVQRTELNPIEKGQWVLEMLEMGRSLKDITKRIGKTEKTVKRWKEAAETALAVVETLEKMSPREEKALEAIVKSTGKEMPQKEQLEPIDFTATTLESITRHTKDEKKQAEIATVVKAFGFSKDKTQQMLKLSKERPERSIAEVAKYVEESISLNLSIFLPDHLAEKLNSISTELNKSMKETVEWIIEKAITEESMFNLLRDASKREK